MSCVTVIVESTGSARGVVRTADMLLRQTWSPLEIVFAAGVDRAVPVVQSTAERVGGTVVTGSTRVAALNEAAARGRGEYVAFVPAGFALAADCIERCLSGFEAQPEKPAAVAPAIRRQSRDGIHSSVWQPSSITFIDLVADPAGAPPVVVVRAAAWRAAGELDSAVGRLAVYELLLRIAAEHPIRVAADAIAFLGAECTRSPNPAAASEHLQELRAALTRHRALIERDTAAIVIRREVASVRLRERHAALVARRDAGLAELDRLRAEAAHARAWLEHHGRSSLDWGDLRRPDPVSRDWGFDRGGAIDRRYITDFLAAHSADVRGRVLEIQGDEYTRKYGGDRVTSADVLDLDERNPDASIVADLRHAPHIPAASFDCIILTQTLHLIDDMAAALRECARLLKPGGVLLATIPAATRSCLEYGLPGDHWRATPAGSMAIFESVFGAGSVTVSAYGNLLTNIAFLAGFGIPELTDTEFDRVDPYYPALTGVRATLDGPSVLRRRNEPRGAVLLYHRVDDTADVHNLNVAPSRFSAQLDWLAEHCAVVPLETLLDARPSDVPPRTVALTFDDGYIDNLEQAVPLLEAVGLPATFFVTTRWLDAGGEYWWDTLERVLLAPAALPGEVRLSLHGELVTLPLATADDRRSGYWRVYRSLVAASREVRDAVIAEVRALSPDPPGARRPMTRPEISALARRRGVHVGAHSVDHLRLPDQTDEVAVQEIEESIRALEALVASPVRTFAFPYGAVDRRVASAVRERCRWGIASGDRAVPASFDRASVGRIEIKDWDVDRFAARVLGAFSAASGAAS